MVFLGAASLRHAIAEFVEHYHLERNHQGLENRIPKPVPIVHESTSRSRVRKADTPRRNAPVLSSRGSLTSCSEFSDTTGDAPQRQLSGAQPKIHYLDAVADPLPGSKPAYVSHSTERRLESKIHSLSCQAVDLPRSIRSSPS